MNGELQQKTILKVFPINNVRTALGVLMLVIIGVTAITLRTRLRIPIGIPGHHGLEVMALLMMGRTISRIPFAGSISTLSAALFLFVPFLGYKDPFLPAIYVVVGGSMDLMFYFFKSKNYQLLVSVLIGGVSYMMIPVARILITFSTGYPYNTFIKSGYLVPVLSHLLFGIAGALLGAGLVHAIKQIRSSKE